MAALPRFSGTDTVSCIPVCDAVCLSYKSLLEIYLTVKIPKYKLINKHTHLFEDQIKIQELFKYLINSEVLIPECQC